VLLHYLLRSAPMLTRIITQDHQVLDLAAAA
jgi:hypothetical protein